MILFKTWQLNLEDVEVNYEKKERDVLWEMCRGLLTSGNFLGVKLGSVTVAAIDRSLAKMEVAWRQAVLSDEGKTFLMP